jgi:hypothetical protein
MATGPKSPRLSSTLLDPKRPSATCHGGAPTAPTKSFFSSWPRLGRDRAPNTSPHIDRSIIDREIKRLRRFSAPAEQRKSAQCEQLEICDRTRASELPLARADLRRHAGSLDELAQVLEAALLQPLDEPNEDRSCH